MAIPRSRQLHFELSIGRPDGVTWVNVTPYLRSVTVNHGDVDSLGTGNTGVDGTVRQMQFTLANQGGMQEKWSDTTARDSAAVIGSDVDVIGDDQDSAADVLNLLFDTQHTWAVDSFAPRDKTSSWNLVDGQWVPLLWENREVILRIAITAPGVAPQEGDWITRFHGFIGDHISTTATTVTCECRDLAKPLQDTFIETVREYGGVDEEGAANVPAETVIQQIMADNLGATAPTLYVPVAPPFHVAPYQVEYASVWDEIQKIPIQFGWWLGHKWDSASGEYRLTLLQPPRDKTTADHELSWTDDIYVEDLDLDFTSIRNAGKLTFRNIVTGERETVTYEDAASIAEFGRRAFGIEEDDASLIDTEAEATAMLTACVADLKDPTGTVKIDMPLLPTVELFDMVSVTNPLIHSDSVLIGVHSLRDTMDFVSGKCRTEIIGAGKVIGAKTRWLRMQTRPYSAGMPVKGTDITTDMVLPAPVNFDVISSGTEQVGQSTVSYVVLGWERPAGYYPGRYALQIRRKNAEWSAAQTIDVPEGTLQQKLHLPGALNWEVRIAAVSREGQQGTWSGTIEFMSPADPDGPTISAGITVTPAIRGLTVTLNPSELATDWSKVPDWDGAEIHIGTTSDFTPSAATLKDRGKKQEFTIPWASGETGYVKVAVYDTSNNPTPRTYVSHAGVEAGKAGAGDISDGAMGNEHVSPASDITRLFTAGRITMPSYPNSDFTYGYDITLGETVPFNDISVVTSLFGWNTRASFVDDKLCLPFAPYLGQIGTGDLANGGNTFTAPLFSWSTNMLVGKALMVSSSNLCEIHLITANSGHSITIGIGARISYSAGEWGTRQSQGATWYASTGTYSFYVLDAFWIWSSISNTYDLWIPGPIHPHNLAVDPDEGGGSISYHTERYFKVTAYDGVAESSSCAAVGATVNAPSNNGVFALSWSPVAGAVSYNVYMGETENGPFYLYNTTPLTSMIVSTLNVSNDLAPGNNALLQVCGSVVPRAWWDKRGLSENDEVRIASAVQYDTNYKQIGRAAVPTVLYDFCVETIDQHIGLRGVWD